MIKEELYNGDCLRILRTVKDASVQLVFCDLPYGVTHNKWDSLISLPKLWAQLRRIGTPRASYVFTATLPFASDIVNSWRQGFRYDLVWPKGAGTGFLDARCRPMSAHELILVFSAASNNGALAEHQRMVYNPQMRYGSPFKRSSKNKPSENYGSMKGTGGGGVAVPNGARYPLSVLPPIARCRSKLHPTQKPVALMEWLVATYSNKGDTVLDPTMGSGTTGVACARLGRNFIGIEKDAKYFETAAKRTKAERAYVQDAV